jgi:hypothetical protein
VLVAGLNACAAVRQSPEARTAAELQRNTEQLGRRGGEPLTHGMQRNLYLGSDDIVRAGGPAASGPPTDDGPWQPRQIATELAPEGLPVWLDLPEGVGLRRVDDGVEVSRGTRFALRVTAGVFALAERKRALESDRLQPVVRYLVDRPDALLYEVPATVVEPGVTEFHVLVLRELAGRTYRCEDMRGPRYSRAEAEVLLATCLSLRGR